MISRIYSTLLAVLQLEVIANAVFQSQYLGLGKWWVLFYVTVPIVGMLVNSWWRGRLGFWAYVHGATVLIAMWRWPLLVNDPTTLPQDFQAWVWWLVGTATISMGIANPRWLGLLYLVVASVTWYFLDTSIYGGSGNPNIAMQDAFYVFLLGGAISALVRLTRDAAKRADQANSIAIANAIEQAQVVLMRQIVVAVALTQQRVFVFGHIGGRMGQSRHQGHAYDIRSVLRAGYFATDIAHCLLDAARDDGGAVKQRAVPVKRNQVKAAQRFLQAENGR